MSAQESTSHAGNWKQKLKHELVEYFTNAAYLAVFFTAYVFYRRMILAEYEVHMQDYFAGVVKALIIAKVIMLAAFLRVSRKFENKPLIIPVLYKSLLFTVCVAIFDFLEKCISGWIHFGTLSKALNHALENHFNAVWLAGLLVVLVTFIPFFTLKEMSRVFGTNWLKHLFFGNKGKAA